MSEKRVTPWSYTTGSRKLIKASQSAGATGEAPYGAPARAPVEAARRGRPSKTPKLGDNWETITLEQSGDTPTRPGDTRPIDPVNWQVTPKTGTSSRC